MKTNASITALSVRYLVFASAILFTSAAIKADVLPLVNGGFESPAIAPGDYTQGPSLPDGWTLSQGNFWGGLQYPSWTPPEGQQTMWARLNYYASGYQSFTMFQNSTATAVAGMSYDVGFAVADTWAAGTTATVRLLMGGAVVSETTVGTTSGFASYTTPDYVASANDAGNIVGLEIYVNNLGGLNDANFLLDAVTLNATVVPEPAAATLIIAGGLLVASRRLRHGRLA